jgi:hypothetical protein
MTCITNENHIYSHEHVGRGAAHRTSSVAPPLSSPHTFSSDKRRVFKTSGACRLTGAFKKITGLEFWQHRETIPFECKVDDDGGHPGHKASEHTGSCAARTAAHTCPAS